ncbi:hypothetical protein RX916_18575, partial [Pseudomonas syringae pv. actinidiae]|nr:hypothetical protein [Pseudomonas syringae pv. actinidiae]
PPAPPGPPPPGPGQNGQQPETDDSTMANIAIFATRLNIRIHSLDMQLINDLQFRQRSVEEVGSDLVANV